MQRTKSIPAFIRNTYQMLERQQLKEIVCWLQIENGFVIKNLAAFTNEVLPQYFKHKKYPSFVRQPNCKLNMYGFHKQRSKDNYHSYGHQFFKKGILENNDRVLFQTSIKRKPEKKKKLSTEVSNIFKKGKSQLGKNQSQRQFSQKRSVSIELEEEMCPFEKQQEDSKVIMKKQFPKKDTKQSEQSQKDIQQQNEESSGNQTKLGRIVVQQNVVLQTLHTTIRQQLLKCKEIARNKALGYGQILNVGNQVSFVLRLAQLIKEQKGVLERLVNRTNDQLTL